MNNHFGTCHGPKAIHPCIPLCLLICTMAGRSTAAEAEFDRTSIVRPGYLRNHAETRGFSLGRPIHAVPTPDGKAVVFLRSPPRVPRLELYEFDIASHHTQLLLSPDTILKGGEETLSAEEKSLRERMRISSRGFASFQLSKSGQHVLLTLSGKLYLLDRSTRQWRELKTSAGALIDPKFSPDGKRIAYVLDYDIYVYDLPSDTEQRVTSGGTELVSHGLAEFVAREEMLRFSGYWWSPDSNLIAYQTSDATGVEIWHVADPAEPDSPPYRSLYPRPGKANVKVQLDLVRIGQTNTIPVRWDRERFPYLGSVRWDEHGPLTLAVQTRDQKELLLLEVNSNSGMTEPLLSEGDEAWVDIRQDVPRWLADDKGFLWASSTPRHYQLEWRDRHGRVEKVLCPSTAGFREIVDVNSSTGEIVFTAGTVPTRIGLHRISLRGAISELSGDAEWHQPNFADNHSVYTDQIASLRWMPRVGVYRGDGTKLAELESVAEEPSVLPQVEIAKVGSGDGFYTAMLRPHDFDRRKRYPVIVYVYGGPLPLTSSGVVRESMQAWLLHQWIADQGFLVVAIDGRGTPGRGHNWERAIYQRLGSVPLADQVTGLKTLGQQHPEIDLSRVGIFGASFGGYMSALAVAQEPEVYKAAVAISAVTDWLDYDTHYTERYLGIPPADARAYEEASILPYASKLRRPLMLVYGTADDNVYPRHTLKLADRLFREGKHFELLPLVGQTHGIRDPQLLEQLQFRMIAFFKQHLGKLTAPK